MVLKFRILVFSFWEYADLIAQIWTLILFACSKFIPQNIINFNIELH